MLVGHDMKRVTYAAGKKEWRPLTRTWLGWSELVLCFAAAPTAKYVSIGSLVWELKCLPIGGVVSTAAASAVLGRGKWTLGQNPDRQRRGFSIPKVPWDATIAIVQYFDDICAASRCMCSTCTIDAGGNHLPVCFRSRRNGQNPALA